MDSWKVLIVLLALGVASASVAQDDAQRRARATDIAPLELHTELETREIPVGDPVRVVLTLTNVSRETIAFNPTASLRLLEFEFTPSVRDSIDRHAAMQDSLFNASVEQALAEGDTVLANSLRGGLFQRGPCRTGEVSFRVEPLDVEEDWVSLPPGESAEFNLEAHPAVLLPQDAQFVAIVTFGCPEQACERPGRYWYRSVRSEYMAVQFR